MFDILFPAWLTGMILSLITAPLGAFVVWRKMAYFWRYAIPLRPTWRSAGYFSANQSLYRHSHTHAITFHRDGLVGK